MSDLTPHQPSRPLIWPDVVLELQELLRDNPDPIYVVGGAVRDALLNHPIHDIDLATGGDSIRLARQIANHLKGDFFVLDDERGVGRVLFDAPDGRMMVDVAHLRGTSLMDDLGDRDFTVNSMAVDLKGDLSLLIDPLNGENDSITRQIRRCSPNALSADPVRVLRAVRQSVQFAMHIETETLRDIRSAASELKNSSPERTRDEFFKLLSLSNPAAALRIADKLGLLKIIVPEVSVLHSFQQPAPHNIDAWEHTLSVIQNLTGMLATISYTRTDNTVASFSFGVMAIQLDRYRKQLITHLDTLWPNERPHRALLMFIALMHDVGKSASGDTNKNIAEIDVIKGKITDERTKTLRLSNSERQRITQVVQNLDLPLRLDDTNPLAIHRFWRRLGEAGVDVCLLALADHLGIHGAQLKQDSWLIVVERVRVLLEAYYEKHDQLISPPALVDGNQLLSLLGLKPGPIIGQLLDTIREAQVEGTIQSVQDALNLAQSLLDEKKFNA